MSVLKLDVPNNASDKSRRLYGLIAVLCLVAVAAAVTGALQHQAYFRAHYILCSVLGAAFLIICFGYAVIFFDEALLQEKGQIQLTDEGFEIGDNPFLLSMIRKVSVVVKGYRGQKTQNASTARGDKNSFVFYTKKKQTISCGFWLKSKEELVILESIMRIWKATGIELVIEGIDLR